MRTDEDLDGPATLAATTLLSLSMLYSDVHTAGDAVARAMGTIARAMASIADEMQSRE